MLNDNDWLEIFAEDRTGAEWPEEWFGILALTFGLDACEWRCLRRRRCKAHCKKVASVCG